MNKHTICKTFGHITLCAFLSAMAASSASAANIYWTAGDGDWGTAGNWGAGVPTGADRAYFRVDNGGGSQTEVNVTIGANQSFSLERLLVFQGKTVNLQMQSGSSLNSSSLIGIGTRISDPLQPAALYISGPQSGTASMSFATGIQVGQAGNNPDGNLLQVSGAGLTLDVNAVTVGRFANANRMVVADGAAVDATSVNVAGVGGIATDGVGNNNSLLVTGSGTRMTSGGTNSALGLVVSSRGATGLSESQMQHGNSVTISDGARFSITGNGATEKQVQIGMATFRHSNSVTVEGTGSVLELLKGSGSVGTVIGAQNASTWDNSLVVRNGGLLRSDGTTTISGRNTDNAKNRVEIGSGGTFHSGKDITVSGGLIQLKQGGVLLGKDAAGNDAAIAVEVSAHEGTSGLTGRFEAEGSGLGENVTVNIRNQGVFAVGVEGRAEEAVLSLNSDLNLFDGSTLEIGIFGSNAADSIDFGANASLNLGASVGDSVTLLLLAHGSHVFAVGDTYQIFSGNTSGISGEFSAMVLPTLTGDLFWDTSAFNQAGGWALTVVPEPGEVAVWLVAAAAAAVALRRRRARLA